MIIISDTSPFCYLILIDCINILPQLYSKVIIPEVVYQELTNQGSPKKVREYLQKTGKITPHQTTSLLRDTRKID